MRDQNLAATAEAAVNDTRSATILLMAQALTLLDSKPTISRVAGAHLQMAIDSAWQGSTTTSQDLH